MSENVQTFSGKVNVADNLLVGTSHFFVDRQNNRVGIGTSTPDASSMLDVTGNIKSGGTITATGGFSGDGSGLSGVNSDSGSWVNGSSSNIHLAVSTDKVGIGVLDPSYKLDVDGDINISSTSTLRVGGTPAVFSNWSVDGSDIYRSSGNVGIGVTAPTELLDIAAAPGEYDAFIRLRSGSGATSPVTESGLKLTESGEYGFQFAHSGATDLLKIRHQNSAGNVDLDNIMVWKPNGDVGIGTSPGQNLHVHEAGSGQVVIAVTNDTTGGTNNDGIHFGLDASENGFIWHKQNTELQFATNNTKRVHITGSGLVHHANSQKYNFHYNAATWSLYTNVNSTATNLFSTTINFPYDGYIFVKGQGHWARYSSVGWHVGGNQSFYAWISLNNQESAWSGQYNNHTGTDTNSYDKFHSYQAPVSSGAGSWRNFHYSNFYKVSAGNNTLSLRVNNYFGSGHYIAINGVGISGFYMPKNYL